MTNDDLQLDVAAELSWDPKVDSQAIAVSADDGTVTLRGTVGNLREKREAGKAAARVYESPRSVTNGRCGCWPGASVTTPTWAATCSRPSCSTASFR
ncbi:MAG: BON domain-containing protein [Streptosporangiaceae bacterium]